MTPHTTSVQFETLGCKLNFAETAALSQSVVAKGFNIVGSGLPSEYFVINTCSVTENADQKCRKLIRDYKRANPRSRVVIVGCFAQLKPDEIKKIEGVDLVLGAGEKFKLGDFLQGLERDEPLVPLFGDIKELQDFVPAFSTGERTRSFLKVQDGCDYSCTFCTIPLARGKSRNGSIPQITETAHQLGDNGVKEIVLTGVNIGDFGRTTGETFFQLIQALDQIKSIPRFRISSIEPNLLSSEIIEFVADSQRFMPHFHLPLQSGSDKILGLMRRRYKSELYRKKIDKILEKIPGAGIGVDIIVGFPGETETEFMETFHFLKSLPVSYFHVFSYSERNNTPAINFPQKVPSKDKALRSKILHDLSLEKSLKFVQNHLGKSFPVLFERAPKDGMMQGFTPNYIKLEEAYLAEKVNNIVKTPVSINNSLLKMVS